MFPESHTTPAEAARDVPLVRRAPRAVARRPTPGRPAPVAWPPMTLVEDVGLAPLAGDLDRVEARLADAVRAEDRFLGEVAGHLLGAGGKRLRPMLTLCAAYAAHGRRRPGGRRRRHRRVLGRARPPRVAVPRRRDRRGRDPPRRAERQRPLVEHRRDPRRRLPARAGVGARGVARRRRRRAARVDDRRAVPRPGARAAVPVRRRTATQESYFSSIEGKTASLMATACRIGGMVSDVLGRHARRAHAVRPPPRHVLPDRRRRARRHAQRRRARQAGRQRRARRRVHAAGDLRARASGAELRELLGRKLEWPEVETVVALVADPTSIDASLAVARTHAAKANEALAGAPELDADVCDRLAHARRRARAPLVVTVSIDDARAVFARRVDAWLAADVDAYLECWHDDMELDAARRARRSPASTRTARWSSSRSRGRHRCRSTCTHSRSTATYVLADWTIRARRREDDVVVEWRGLSICELRDGRITLVARASPLAARRYSV